MNHRYSYCKKEAQSQGGGRESPEEDGEAQAEMVALSRAQRRHLPPSQLDSDERGSSTREDESEEDEEEEEDVDGAVDMDDIQVVQIGDEGGEEEEDEEEGGRNEEKEEEVETVVAVAGGMEENRRIEMQQEKEEQREEEADTRQEEEKVGEEQGKVEAEDDMDAIDGVTSAPTAGQVEERVREEAGVKEETNENTAPEEEKHKSRDTE